MTAPIPAIGSDEPAGRDGAPPSPGSGYYDRLREPGTPPPPTSTTYPRLAEVSGVHPTGSHRAAPTDTGPRRHPGDTGRHPRPDGDPRRADTGADLPPGDPHRRGRRDDTGTPPGVDDDPDGRPPRRSRRDRGHGHGHGPATPVSRRVRTLIAALLIPMALATVAGVLLLYPFNDPTPDSALGAQHSVRGEITAATGARPCTGDTGTPGNGPAQRCDQLTVRLTSGEAAGTTIQQTVPVEPSTPVFAQGDRVVLAYSGSEPRSEVSYRIVDFQRDKPILLLAALFALAVIILGRWHGLAALAALGLSFLVLGLFVFPALLAGENPLWVAIAGGGVIMFLVLYLTHGFSARTSTALLGTLTSLVLIGVLSYVFSAAARLTGLNEGTATLIGSLGHGVDSRGLLLAGIIIGALGVLDDVTVTQASAVWELRRANPAYGFRQLYSSAVRIGRDHVGSAVNTLAMAYAGASLPLLLLFTLSHQRLGEILTSQLVAEELVRTLVGSIGLVASVPVTTALAALVASREPVT